MQRENENKYKNKNKDSWKWRLLLLLQEMKSFNQLVLVVISFFLLHLSFTPPLKGKAHFLGFVAQKVEGGRTQNPGLLSVYQNVGYDSDCSPPPSFSSSSTSNFLWIPFSFLKIRGNIFTFFSQFSFCFPSTTSQQTTQSPQRNSNKLTATQQEKHQPIFMTSTSSKVTGPLFRAGILTISDRVSAGTAKDESGPALEKEISESPSLHAEVVERGVVPDEKDQIKSKLIQWTDELHLDLIITTGGTGFAPRDVTPEATKEVIEKETPGLVFAMIQNSLLVTPHAMLSRSSAGIRKQTLIVNLPGSVKAVKENFTAILPALPHGLSLLRNSPEASKPEAHQAKNH
jgi:molybdopterin adenylyltransferase